MSSDAADLPSLTEASEGSTYSRSSSARRHDKENILGSESLIFDLIYLGNSIQNVPRSLPTPDINYFLEELMIPRVMKISIANTPFQKVIFVLVLKVFEKSKYLENFIFEWLDLKTTTMVLCSLNFLTN
jgi:hypothetical protein